MIYAEQLLENWEPAAHHLRAFPTCGLLDYNRLLRRVCSRRWLNNDGNDALCRRD